jgi:thiol-disulfide isomerase/thioredoxin
VILRMALAAGILLLLGLVYVVWRRVPQKLAGMNLSGLGIQGPALVQFSTRYCAPCRAAAPRLRAAGAVAGVAFHEFDVSERPELSVLYGIRSVPTIAMTDREGRTVAVWTSLPPPDEIVGVARRAAAPGLQ